MPRPGINFDDVANAAESILISGEKITIQKLRDTLGGGSPTTISKYYKEWLEKTKASSAQSATPEKSETPSSEQNETSDLFESAEQDNAEAKPVEASTATEKNEKKKSIMTRPSMKVEGPTSDSNASVKALIDNAKTLSQEMLAIMSNEWDIILTERDPEIKAKKLHAALIKEQTRRESAENMCRDAQLYATAIKEQTTHRINDLRDTLESQIAFLNGQIRNLKKAAEEDLTFYRKKLSEANEKLTELSKK